MANAIAEIIRRRGKSEKFANRYREGVLQRRGAENLKKTQYR